MGFMYGLIRQLRVSAVLGILVLAVATTTVVAHDGDFDCERIELDKGRIQAVDMRIANTEDQIDSWIDWFNLAIEMGDLEAAITFAGIIQELEDEVARLQEVRVFLQHRIVHGLQHCPDH